MCPGTFSRRGAVASATIYSCAECASSFHCGRCITSATGALHPRGAFLYDRTQFPIIQKRDSTSSPPYPELSVKPLLRTFLFFSLFMFLYLYFSIIQNVSINNQYFRTRSTSEMITVAPPILMFRTTSTIVFPLYSQT